MKSVQWLTEIEVVAHDYKGYYQQKGWTEEAIVKTMSRIDVPGHGATVRGLRQRVEGIAFAGSRVFDRSTSVPTEVSVGLLSGLRRPSLLMPGLPGTTTGRYLCPAYMG